MPRGCHLCFSALDAGWGLITAFRRRVCAGLHHLVANAENGDNANDAGDNPDNEGATASLVFRAWR